MGLEPIRPQWSRGFKPRMATKISSHGQIHLADNVRYYLSHFIFVFDKTTGHLTVNVFSCSLILCKGNGTLTIKPNH